MLNEKELAFLRRLVENRVDFIVLGMSAAALQGAPALTEDVDLWFRDLNHPGIRKAAESLGGRLLDLSALMRPPVFEGEAVEIFDVVLTVHGIEDFQTEWDTGTVTLQLGDVPIRVLTLERILASKKAANRDKDRMAVSVLEATLKVAGK
jgi:hypothetical protein